VYHIGKTLLDIHKGNFDEQKAEEEAGEATRSKKPGKECPSCHEFAVIKTGGCEECTSCDWRGECG
jgi:hypothetical protein